MAAGTSAAAGRIGRPVRVVSIGFQSLPLDEIVAVVDQEGAKGADLIALPETCRGREREALDGPTVTAMAGLARRHRAYVICPIYRGEGEQRLNTAVLLDRQGEIAGLYDKVYPYWSEFDLAPPCAIGCEAPVFRTDFGHVGIAICFDANFTEVWKRLADQGAELVIWPSAYSAGTTLQAHALLYHFTIVTATGTSDCLVYDITGEEIHYQKGDGLNVSRVTVDLGRRIIHHNFNKEKRARRLREPPDDVVEEQFLAREQWFVLKAKRPGVSAQALAREYGLEELRDYIERSRRAIDGMRGAT